MAASLCNRISPTLKNILSTSCRNNNRNICCHSASITRMHRLTYERMYPTVLVLPDGSSINIRYHEPRKIITLPLDLSTLTDEERRLRLEKRKPKKKVKIQEEIVDDFDPNKYIKYIRK